jgi:hypothetical protein
MKSFHENGEIKVLVMSIELSNINPAISTDLIFRNF